MVLRRALVVLGVVASLLVGLVSVRVAADLTAAAVPPAVPPVSIETLQNLLVAERERAITLREELDQLLAATGNLSTAVGLTSDQVTTDGLTADELRQRLAEAEAKLGRLQDLLAAAQARLSALEGPAHNGRSTDGSSGDRPGPTPEVISLTLSSSGGSVVAEWSTCHADAFAQYVLVRSTNKEVHYPPEDGDSIAATVTARSTTEATDSEAPAGTVWYRLYCLAIRDGQLNAVAKSGTGQITVLVVATATSV
jgi:hypothetical protein